MTKCTLSPFLGAFRQEEWAARRLALGHSSRGSTLPAHLGQLITLALIERGGHPNEGRKNRHPTATTRGHSARELRSLGPRVRNFAPMTADDVSTSRGLSVSKRRMSGELRESDACNEVPSPRLTLAEVRALRPRCGCAHARAHTRERMPPPHPPTPRPPRRGAGKRNEPRRAAHTHRKGRARTVDQAAEQVRLPAALAEAVDCVQPIPAEQQPASGTRQPTPIVRLRRAGRRDGSAGNYLATDAAKHRHRLRMSTPVGAALAPPMPAPADRHFVSPIRSPLPRHHWARRSTSAQKSHPKGFYSRGTGELRRMSYLPSGWTGAVLTCA